MYEMKKELNSKVRFNENVFNSFLIISSVLSITAIEFEFSP